MGLLKAGIGALGGVLADSWRDYFYCDSLSSDILATKGKKRTSDKGRSSNTKGESNIISNGSIIAVNEGQCMMIVEQGAIVDVCAEPGEFVYDESSEPSIFYGDLQQGIVETFARLGARFSFGGDTGKDQRVYFFNTKEIMGNKYGTASPIPFRVVDANIGLDMDINIRCNGEYSYRIVDPLLFYKNVCGNVEGDYDRSMIDAQLKTELLTSLQPAFARLSEMGIRYSAIPAHTSEIAGILRDILTPSWTELRGIGIVAFGVNSVSASEEDERTIKELQKANALRDPSLAAASLAAAQGDAMRAAAANEAGAMNGFMGVGMASSFGGMNAQGLFDAAARQGAAAAPQQHYPQDSAGGFTQPQTAAPAPAPAPAQAPVPAPAPAQPAGKAGWTCACGSVNTGKFCPECGSPAPAPAEWTCACGSVNTGKFCPECGSSRP